MDETETDIKLINWNGVGGGTLLWGGAWPRMRPGDFRVFSQDGVAADWPLSYDELAPFYDRVDVEFGACGLAGDPTYPPGPEFPMPPLPLTEGGLRVARAHARLGWHWWPHPCAINTVPYDGRHACVQRGACMSGCNEGAKASVDLTHWRKFEMAGGRLVTGARVSRLTTDAGGLATGAEWIDDAGGAHHQAADVVLLGANAIGTARLMLMSAAEGLANSSGLVGRGLMLHPIRRVVASFDDNIGAWQGPAGASLICTEFLETDESRGFVRGAKWTLAPNGGPMMTALRGGADAWGPGHHDYVRARLGHGVGWNMMAEDLPEDDNRVVLSNSLVDSSGLPAPKVIYRTAENAKRMLDFHEVQARRSLTEAGALLIDIQPGGVNGHFMGTTRMGDDPAGSVTNRWGMTHDIANLGVIDGGVFVTASAFNPTRTIAALALRAAEHLLETRRDVPAPSHGAVVAVSAPRRPPAPPEPVYDLEFTPLERERLAVLADALIPAAPDRPSASQAGVAGAMLDRMLALRPDLAAPLRRILAEGAEGRADRGVLTTIVAGAYYLAPSVREAIGYPGQEARPFNPREFESFIAEGLLDHVLAKEPAGV
jgi:choline dehydrogenase-like flavoprotein